MDGGLIPQPYRKAEDGETDVYRIPVHFIGGNVKLCHMGGKDGVPGELDHCPYHGEVTRLCEVNPDHLMARIPAVAFISTTLDSATPACHNCYGGVLSAKLPN